MLEGKPSSPVPLTPSPKIEFLNGTEPLARSMEVTTEI